MDLNIGLRFRLHSRRAPPERFSTQHKCLFTACFVFLRVSVLSVFSRVGYVSVQLCMVRIVFRHVIRLGFVFIIFLVLHRIIYYIIY